MDYIKKVFNDENDMYVSFPSTDDNVICKGGETLRKKLDDLSGNVSSGDGSNITDASKLSIKDVNNNFTSTNVEGALEEVATQCKNIPIKTSVENNKLYLIKKDGTKIDTGTTLPSNTNNNTLVTINKSGTTLSLTKDKYQTSTVSDGIEITLPTVTAFTEIHLFFSTTQDLTLILPSCKWQNGNTPTISANKTYEFIFTYTTEWLGGVIVYE